MEYDDYIIEYDKDLIERFLEIWEFDMNEIDIDKVQHVPMHDYRVSTVDKPLLYIGGLQCCIGLYIYGNGFAFAAHINTVVFANNDYILNEEKKPIYCNRCDDLVYEVLKYKGEIIEPFKIGISIGVAPLDKNDKAMSLIYDGVNNAIKKLNALNIPVVRQEDIYNSEFIIDSTNNNIIVPVPKKDKRSK